MALRVQISSRETSLAEIASRPFSSESDNNFCMDVSIYRLRTRDVLTLCVLSLLLLGILMVQSASMHVYAESPGVSKTTTQVEIRKWTWTDQGMNQLRFAGIAVLTFWFVGR